VDFWLFLLVNAMLFIRPAEFTTALLGLPVYEATVLTCLAVSFPAMLGRVGSGEGAGSSRPIGACVVALLPAIVLSHLTHGRLGEAATAGLEFAKVLLYYFLLVSIVNSVDRLRRFLLWLAGFTLLITTLAVLHYRGIVHIPAIEFVQTTTAESSGETTVLRRLGSTGLFQDPNDMSLMLVTSILICAYNLLERRRWPWAGPLGLFVYALMLTHSRGGFLALLVGAIVLLFGRHGRKAIPYGAIVLPILFVLFAGRQTDLTLKGSTGQTRVELWDESMSLFRGSPLFGIGSDLLADRIGHVAHNSFIHAYAELGLLGGTSFLGMFWLAILGLSRIGSPRYPLVDPELRRLRPYLLAIVISYFVGIMTLSCCYIIPTYTVIGLAAVELRLAQEPLPWPILTGGSRLATRLAAISVGFLVLVHAYLRLFARFD
jgi:hypothetical protein